MGAAVRILSGTKFVPTNSRFVVVMIGQTSAALAQPFLLGSPTKLAAVWFGADERATANMIASLSELSLQMKKNFILIKLQFLLHYSNLLFIDILIRNGT